MLTLGSLFDGIGVFPLAASHYNITPIWASEIIKTSISITKRHFPDMLHLGDITKIDGSKIPPCHIITFGSPCQNLSVAGNRTGLEGTKSTLFYQAIRIIHEMRCSTHGLYPIIAVWENVPGALSSNKRMDFRAVLQSFTNSEIPMPFSGKWANAGMVRDKTIDLCWRLLDAQFWGIPRIPQRRKRIFLVTDYRGQSASEILFKTSPLYQTTALCGDGNVSSSSRNRIFINQTGGTIPIIHPFQERKMRTAKIKQDKQMFIQSFGKPTDLFPTLLASGSTPFSLWYGEDYKNGVIRFLTPLESERLMGLPDDWTLYGNDDTELSDSVRTTALGNAIALPCAEYIMSGISDILGRDMK